MKIEIWSDFACPFCYIGKKKIEKALNSFPHKDQVEVIFKSYELNPDAKDYAEENSQEEFAKRKGMTIEQVKAMYQQITLAAKAQGLNYDFDNVKMVRTRKAHRLAKWASTHGKEKELTELLFDAYFTKGLSIADNNVLLNFVSMLGLNVADATKVLNTELFDNIVTREINDGLNLGVRGVPFFVFDRKFAVSGAQPDEVFKEALEKAYEQNNDLKIVDSEDDFCGPEGCEI